MSEKKNIKVAVLAAGGRSRGVVRELLKASDRKVCPVAVFDPDPAEMECAAEVWNTPEIKRCATYREAIDFPGVDWVMVFSPNVHHCEQVLAGFAAGKDVFSEKPLATTIADCRKMYDAYRRSGRRFATGFVLRYSPLYRKAKEILDSGELGRILAIDANENVTPEHGGYIMCNWRRFTKFSGPHILEKCCHDLDLLNWLIGSLPTKVAGFGGLDFFVPANAGLVDKYGLKKFKTWPDAHGEPCPFRSEKDLFDTQVGIAKYRNGVKVQFMATMSNIHPERRMYFSCTEGTMWLDLYSAKLWYRRLGDDFERCFDLGGDGHGGGDVVQMKEIYQMMCDDSQPKSSGSEGLESAVFALSLDEAMRKEQVIDLEPVWKSLER